MNGIDYAEYGIEFVAEEVAKQNGDHASDRATFNTKAQIAVVRDLEKFRAHFGDDTVKGILDGTSVRVMSQDVNRRLLGKGIKDESSLQTAVYNRLKGVRTSTGGTRIVETKVYMLPNGEAYKGTDESEFQQLYAAALVDAGVPADAAIAIAKNQHIA